MIPCGGRRQLGTNRAKPPDEMGVEHPSILSDNLTCRLTVALLQPTACSVEQ